MIVNPVFRGNMQVTAIKDDRRSFYECDTSKEADKKIAKTANAVCEPMKDFSRSFLSKENGEYLISTIEKATGKKIDVPENAIYSTLYNKSYDIDGKKPKCSLFLLCEEKSPKKGNMLGDCTAIDIFI